MILNQNENAKKNYWEYSRREAGNPHVFEITS